MGSPGTANKAHNPAAVVSNTIPNGGWTAWAQVLGAFFIWLNTWGLVNAFGAWQSFYETTLLTNEAPSTIAWIGSTQACLLCVVGALTGPIFDVGHFQPLLVVGTVLTTLGLAMASLADRFWQLLLAQGFCVGIGQGCLFTPSVAIVSTYFSTKVTAATGLAAAGSGIGGVVFPIMFRRLQPSIGFGWTTRAVALITLVTLTASLALMRVRVLPPKRRKLFDAKGWHDPAYCLYVLGGFVSFLGCWTPFFFVTLYAIHLEAGSNTDAFYLLPIMATGSVLGRVLPNIIAVRVGMFNVIVPCTLLTSAVTLGFLGARDYSTLVILSALYGLTSGTLVSILPTIPVQLSPDRSVIGNRMGMAFSTISLGALAGTPIAGHMVRKYGFEAAFEFSGASAAVAAGLLFAARGFHRGWNLTVKA